MFARRFCGIAHCPMVCKTVVRNFFGGETPVKRHFERKLMKYTCEELFDVVSNVAEYHEFVPWCKQSNVLKQTDTKMSAELAVGFSYFSEKYVSEVIMQRPNFVNANSKQTILFEFLSTEWSFAPAKDPKSTWVTFLVEFKFKSSVYNDASELFKKEVVSKMVQAFEDRCKTERAKRKVVKIAS